jgi:acetylornithine deacetylase/succinyl-diaminopimelate desuccinylase-like protein
LLPSVSDNISEEWFSELQEVVESVGASFQVQLNRPPFTTEADQSSVELCQNILSELQLPKDLTTSSTCTEASVLNRFGIPTLVFGPGMAFGNTHQPNEFVEWSEAEQALSFYERLIGNYCL